jgi:dTMP kinase
VRRGRFITLEGGEGVGKSTQIEKLTELLCVRGLTVVQTREPGGTAGAEGIRALLLTGSEDRWNARTEALLFAAARADHVSKLILPALERGDWVLCDRFIDSSRAYQGGGGALSDRDIMDLHRVGSAGLLPDRTLLLRLPPAESARRAMARDGAAADRMGAKKASYYEDVATRFDELAADEPARFRNIDASAAIDAVTRTLFTAIEDLL